MIPRTHFAPEHTLFRDSVRRFVEAELAPHHAQWERDGFVPRETWRAAGAAGLLSMVMGIVYPSIKPFYEMSIRKVTVTVRWKEGPNKKDLALVQYVTNPQRAGFAFPPALVEQP